MRQTMDEFSREKEAKELVTSYGVPYSPHYLQESRARRHPQKDPSP